MAWVLGCALGGGPFPAVADPVLPVPRSAGLLGAAVLWQSRAPAPVLAVAFLLTAWAGGEAAAIAWQPAPLATLAGHRLGLAGPWRVRGRLLGPPEPTATGALVRLQVEQVRVDGNWERLRGRVEVAVDDRPPPAVLAAGTGVEVFLALRADDPPANPGLPRRDRLRVRGLDLRSRLKSFAQLRARAPAGPFARWRARLRDRVRSILDTHTRPSLPARALVLGERLPLADHTLLTLARSGLIHLFAISGLHVGLLAGVVAGLARLLGGSPRAAAVAALAGALLVCVLAIPAASVRRAVTMAVAMLSGLVLGRRHDAPTGLAAAVLVLGWIDPVSVRDPGLQLSAAATAGLVLGLPGDRSPTTPLRRAGRMLVDVLRASWVAQLAVAPLLALQGRAIPTAGLLLNLAGVPLLALTLMLLLVTVCLGLLGVGGAATAGTGASTALRSLLALARHGAAWPTVMLPSMSWLLATLWWCGLGFGLRGGDRMRLAAAPALLVVAAIAARPLPVPAAPSLLALDVGEGDALLLMHHDEALLVDAGGYPGLDYDVGAHVVVPVLRSLGVGRLAAAALSHPHVDHGGGLPAVLERSGAAELWTGSHPLDSRLAASVDLAAGTRTRRLTPRGPARRLVGGCVVRSLLPDLPHLLAGSHAIDNDASLVLAVRCGRRHLLLPGDAGAPVEAAWTRTGLRGGVLKVGHHGSASATSGRMLDALRPRQAVISVGRRNVYGLPADEVLRRLRDRAIAVYRTDRDGAVTVVLGARVRVRGRRWVAGRGARR